MTDDQIFAEGIGELADFIDFILETFWPVPYLLT
jgi:hypothetical protein